MTTAQQATLDVLYDLVDVNVTNITAEGKDTAMLLLLSAPRSHGQVQTHQVWLNGDGGLEHQPER